MQDFYFLKRPEGGVRKAGTILFSLAHPNPITTAERIAGTGPEARFTRICASETEETMGRK